MNLKKIQNSNLKILVLQLLGVLDKYFFDASPIMKALQK
jgi:hypothetical protein